MKAGRSSDCRRDLGSVDGHWHYRAFGLIIRSDMPIEELAAGSVAEPDRVDVEIVRSDGLRPTSGLLDALEYDLRNEGPDIDHFHWRDVGSFAVVGDARIQYDPNPNVGPDLLSLPLLGTVMAVLLHRRGLMVLHGSAVKVADRAVVFVGDKGAGKSTTAAALAAAGRGVLTDDIVALGRSPEGGIHLLPGHAQVKLSQAATDHLHLATARILDRPYAGYEKHRHVFDKAFDTSPIGVADIFVLARGAPAVDRLTGTEALKAVMRYAYLTRFGQGIYRTHQAAAFLKWCSDVVRTVPVSRLTVPDKLNELASLNDFLEARAISRSDGAQ